MIKVIEVPSVAPKEGQLFKVKDRNEYGVVERDGKSFYSVIGRCLYDICAGETYDIVFLDPQDNVIGSTDPVNNIKMISKSFLQQYVTFRLNGARINRLKK